MNEVTKQLAKAAQANGICTPRVNEVKTLENKDALVDDAIELQNQCKCIALGETTGRVAADGYSVVEVWAKHQSSLNIIAKDNAFVMVDVYDYAVVNVYASDRAKVCVNRHGGKVSHATTDDAVVKIREMSNK